MYVGAVLRWAPRCAAGIEDWYGLGGAACWCSHVWLHCKPVSECGERHEVRRTWSLSGAETPAVIPVT
jgi:hypothetical protein